MYNIKTVVFDKIADTDIDLNNLLDDYLMNELKLDTQANLDFQLFGQILGQFGDNFEDNLTLKN